MYLYLYLKVFPLRNGEVDAVLTAVSFDSSNVLARGH